MTISTESTRVEFTGDGATLPFAVPFKFLDKTDLVVVLRTILTGVDAVQTLYTHYTVLGAGDASGTVTFVTAPPSTQRVVVYNDPPLTQLVDYLAGDTFPAETHETALDRLTIQQKRTREITTRAILLPDADTDGSGAYDAKSNRIKSLGTPTAASDAATKTYTDALVNNTALGPAPTGLIATGSVTSRLLADRWGEVKNVKDFGATGDGVTDDTVAIQAAITAAGSYDTVLFPGGSTYVISNLAVTSVSHLTLEMHGATLLQLAAVPALTSMLDVTDVSHFALHGGTFNGNRAAQTASRLLGENGGLHAIAMRRVTFSEVVGVDILDMYTDGIIISGKTGVGTAHCTDLRIANVSIKNVARNGCSVIGGERIHFDRCSFVGAQGQDPEAGVDIEPDHSYQNVKDVTFTNCDLSGNNGSGFTAFSKAGLMEGITLRGCSVIGNNLDGTSNGGVVFTGSTGSTHKNHLVDNCTITGNDFALWAGAVATNTCTYVSCGVTNSTLDSTEAYTVYLRDTPVGGVQTWTMTGNRVSANYSGTYHHPVVKVEGSTGFRFSDNIVDGGGGGIWLDLCANSVVHGNIFTGQDFLTVSNIGIRVDCDDAVVTSNHLVGGHDGLSAAGGIGIRVDGTDTVVANNRSHGYYYGIRLLAGGLRTTVTGNVLSDNWIDVGGINTTTATSGNTPPQATPTVTFTASDATPTVATGRTFITAGALAITDFDDGVDGQIITVRAHGAITLTDSANLQLQGDTDFVMALDDTVTLANIGGTNWYETGRRPATTAAEIPLFPVVTFAGGDATPTVLNGKYFLTAGTTAITDFDDGVVGQTITVKAKTSITITDAGDLELVGNFAMTTGDTITLTMIETGKWSEISRSNIA